MPESDPTSRLTRSPRALALAAGGLLVAAAIVVVILVTSGSGSGSGSSTVPPTTASVTSLTLPAPVPGRDNLQTFFTDSPAAVFANPAGEIAELKALGVNRLRLPFAWGSIAPDAGSRTEPHFDATDPGAYPAKNWAPYDNFVRLLAQAHIGLDLVLAPPPPLWASGKGAPHPSAHPYWEPDAREFGQFVEAVGKRYSGTYTPPGQHSPLPRETFWSIWNEPNSGVQLAPQTLNGPKLETAPRYYRALADAAWSALDRTGHGHDTTLIGELAPEGSTVAGAPGNFAVMAPLRFLRALYCVGADFQPLRGTAATQRGCPASAAGSKRFAAENPVLFHATAYADHPYPYGLPPDRVPPDEPDYAVLAELPNLFSTLDRLQRAYGSHKRYDVYSTEFGYQTTPPDTQSGGVSPSEAARWLNWAEYITWRYPRMRSYDQYLLVDPQPIPHKPYRRFASGLISDKYKVKPTWFAFRMASWLPATSAARGKPLEVWGCVRPAKFTATHDRPRAQIQFKPSSGGGWKTVATASVRTTYGYFDVHQTFPSSGSVRIRWAPPTGPAIFSRVTPITIH